MSDPVKRPETPLRRSHGDTFWVITSVLSAVVLLTGAGYHFISKRASGPAVGEKVEMPPSLARATQRAGENLRGMLGDRAATRPAATAPARR
jgi:hypothetical protein